MSATIVYLQVMLVYMLNGKLLFNRKYLVIQVNVTYYIFIEKKKSFFQQFKKTYICNSNLCFLGVIFIVFKKLCICSCMYKSFIIKKLNIYFGNFHNKLVKNY